jgi:hypothetical protein
MHLSLNAALFSGRRNNGHCISASICEPLTINMELLAAASYN